jgi:hypothetical protein
MRTKTLLTAAFLSLLFFASGAKAQIQPKLVVRTSDGQPVGNGAIIELGSVPANTLLTKSFYIYNEGAQPLILGAPPVTTHSPFFIAVPPATSTINPAFNTGFTVGFNSNYPTSYGATVRILSNDPVYPAGFQFSVYATAVGPGLDVTVGGKSVLNNSLYALPNTSPGVSVSTLFTINNFGNAPLTITNFTLTTAGGLFILIAPPTTIAPASTGIFRIRLLSNTPGTYTGTVTFNSNAANLPTYRINLQGTVGAPEIRVVSGDGITLSSGSLYTMQSTTVSVPVSRAFTIYNDGIAPLHISNPAGLVTGAGFSEIGTYPAAEIAPNSSTIFRVRLLSGAAGTYNGLITIQNDDPDENPFTIQLRGTVTP